jgi:anti-anti-sigma factor
MNADSMHFTFSDLIAGYVTEIDSEGGRFTLKTSDGRTFGVTVADSAYAQVITNLGEPPEFVTDRMWTMLVPGRYVYAYGVFYPEAGEQRFEVKQLTFVGGDPQEWRFESTDWWIRQVREIADFYFKAQWPDGNVDFRNYRTHITVEGQRIEDRLRQETDTISRAIYGWATAYMLTGEDRFLEAAEKGTQYLCEHMRGTDPTSGVAYWYHAIDRRGERERKILASQFGDDYDAIPAYEQIYALAGPTQTYRITGDKRIRKDIDMTVELFDRYFLDREKGGYYSHIDPIDLSPFADSLGADRARKNWNSVGDHGPAYLINLWLATGEDAFADRLAYMADTIVDHFPDDEHSPFVQERFHEDWSRDQSWNWQQNRAVVGHNLKIAWNLMRIANLRPNDRYTELARKIAATMPAAGSDTQRGGWYDVVERVLEPGQEWYRFAWHDRKAWWQQEQAILAYFILHGVLGEPEHLRQAREAAAFYNAWFLDHDNEGVYFNVLANGIPYLVGTERLKGSHSMSLYHSTELGYLAAVYTNLLVRGQPMDLFFKPQPGAWKDNVLRVAPDILPAGRVQLDAVWINGEPYQQFDPEALTVTLPPSDTDLRVRVRLSPAEAAKTFHITTEVVEGVAMVTMSGSLEPSDVYSFKSEIDRAIAGQPKRLVLVMSDLYSLAPEAVRVLVFATEHLSIDADLYVVGATQAVEDEFRNLEFEDVIWLGDYDSALIRQ